MQEKNTRKATHLQKEMRNEAAFIKRRNLFWLFTHKKRLDLKICEFVKDKYTFYI